VLAVLKQLQKNIKYGIKMAVLDQILNHLFISDEKELLNALTELEMDQIIILQSHVTDQLKDYPISVTNIKEGEKVYCSVIEKILSQRVQPARIQLEM
jgi:ABC-type Na+ transport system ATPase subunit NatA